MAAPGKGLRMGGGPAGNGPLPRGSSHKASVCAVTRAPSLARSAGEGWGGVGALPSKPQKQGQQHPTPSAASSRLRAPLRLRRKGGGRSGSGWEVVDLRPPPLRGAQGRDGEGLGLYRASHRSKSKSTPPQPSPSPAAKGRGQIRARGGKSRLATDTRKNHRHTADVTQRCDSGNGPACKHRRRRATISELASPVMVAFSPCRPCLTDFSHSALLSPRLPTHAAFQLPCCEV